MRGRLLELSPHSDKQAAEGTAGLARIGRIPSAFFGLWRSLVSARRLGRRGRRFKSDQPDSPQDRESTEHPLGGWLLRWVSFRIHGGRWRNWQRNGLLTRRFWVRIPGDPPHNSRTEVRVRLDTSRVWRNGRRAGFRCPWERSRGGSSPLTRTQVVGTRVMILAPRRKVR